MPDLKRFSKTEHIIFIKKFLLANPSVIGSTNIFKNVSPANESGVVDLWSELYQNYHQRILYPDMLHKDCKNKTKIH